MSQTFAGQVAIVTGAGSGIGRAIALRLAAGGTAIAVVDKDAASAEATLQLLEQSGTQGVAIVADVAQSEDVRRAVQQVVARFGPPHILVNNAGVSRLGRIWEVEEKDWDLTLAVNLRGSYLFCKEVVPLMIEQRRGRIIFITSSTGVRVTPGTGPYAASKAGLIALMKAVAGEVARWGITVNAVAPGLTDTAMTRAAFGGVEKLQEQAASGRIANPMRVVIQPEDIAAAVAFLVSPEARYITGQTLHINAGSFMP